MTIAVFSGGPSAERAISIRSGAEVLDDLLRRGQSALAVLIDRRGRWHLSRDGVEGENLVLELSRLSADPSGLESLTRADAAANSPHESFESPRSPVEAVLRLRERGVDFAFLALHGHPGEDGSIQGFFEWCQLPYSGAGQESSALALDKPVFKALLEKEGLPTAPSRILRRRDWQHRPDETLDSAVSAVGLPAVLKGRESGSSVGVMLAGDRAEAAEHLEELFRSTHTVLWESRVSGPEMTCPVLGPAQADSLEALPIVEIRPKASDWFDYSSKYDASGAEEICPAPIDEDLAAEIRRLALACHRAIACDGLSRTDFIVGSNGPVILEINTIPGMTRQSLAPLSAKESSYGFSGLIDRMIELGRQRRPLLHDGDVDEE